MLIFFNNSFSLKEKDKNFFIILMTFVIDEAFHCINEKLCINIMKYFLDSIVYNYKHFLKLSLKKK